MEQPGKQLQQPDGKIIKLEQEDKKAHLADTSLYDKNFHYSFYLFVNPTSGGNKAAEFTKLETESMTLHLDNPKQKDSKQKYTVDLFFTNLFIQEQREKGFKKLKEEIQKRAVVCGGDGTVMWVVEEMIKYNVDVENCPIGIVAFGTGNDFSRVLGWGASAPGKVIGESLQGLKSLIQKWIFSQIVDFDIWDITVVVDEQKGHFKQVKKVNGKLEKQPMVEKDEKGEQKQKKIIKKHMSNYCSVGVDARIGYGFDKNRTKSQLGNKCVYAWEGMKKFFTRTAKMTDIVDNLEIRLSEQKVKSGGIVGGVVSKIEDIKVQITGGEDGKNNENIQSQICFKGRIKTKKGEKQEINKDDKTPYLKDNPVCIICQNINSYGGGAMDMWRAAKNKLGVESIEKKKINDQFENQNFGDGKLEFVCFGSGLRLSLEQISKGNSQRCAQGQGPFYMNFKDTDERGDIVKTYFQIDGEFYQAVAPKYIKFELAQALPKGKIKVMSENTQKKN